MKDWFKKARRKAKILWHRTMFDLNKAWKTATNFLEELWQILVITFTKFPEGEGSLVALIALLLVDWILLIALYFLPGPLHVSHYVLGAVMIFLAWKTHHHYSKVEGLAPYTKSFVIKSLIPSMALWMAGIQIHLYQPAQKAFWTELMCIAPVGGVLYAMPTVSILWALYIKVRELFAK